MILHLRIILDHKKDVFRDIQLDASKSLEHLHQTIIAAFDLQKGEMASFFLSNKNWDQEDEIPLLSMQEGSSEMKDISIKDVLKNTESKLLYVQDFLTLWRFMIEVEDILGQDSRSDLPKTVLSFGYMPKEAPNVQFVSEVETKDDDDPTADIFDEFNEFEQFDEFESY